LPKPAQSEPDSQAGPSNGSVKPIIGAAARPAGEEDEEDDDDIGPVPPENGAAKRKAEGEADEEDSGEESDEYGLEEVGEEDRTPISHEMILKDHGKVSDCVFAPLQLNNNRTWY
jgi:hypothetical protein